MDDVIRVAGLVEELSQNRGTSPFRLRLPAGSQPLGVILKAALEDGPLAGRSHCLKALVLAVILLVSGPVGCAMKKGYFFHPNKTSAETQADYSQCMYYLDASFSRYGTVSSPGAEAWGSDSQAKIADSVERCMRLKGYRIISEKEAKELGVRTQDPWPPHSKTSSSSGP